MNNKVLCVTCVRDFYKLQRQIESFILYLPIEYEIVYIIEGRNYQEFLKLWDEYSYNHSRLKNKITIKFSHDYVSPYTENYYTTPDYFNGWHRQQLLKLLSVSEQQDDYVIVIDSKDFLIKPLEINIISTNSTQRNDPHVHDDFTEKILPIYEKYTGIYLDTKGGVTTPFNMIPKVVRTAIDDKEQFIKWWITTSRLNGWMSEFQLYHLWHVDQNYPIHENKNLKLAIWRNEYSQIKNKDHLNELLNNAKNFNDDCKWISLSNSASTTWDDDMKNTWSIWLKQNGYIGQWNDFDLNLPEQQ